MMNFFAGFLFALCLISLNCRADSYAFAQYGSATLNYSHAYVQNARTTAPSHTIGIGETLTPAWSVELAFHDLGTYRFTGEKDVSETLTFKLGPFPFSYTGTIALPGYVEARAYGESLGVKYTSPWGIYGKLSALHATVEAELHTPAGYMLYSRSGMLPMVGVGAQYGRFVLDYTVLPKMHALTVGVLVKF